MTGRGVLTALSLGGNLGDVPETMKRAMDLLRAGGFAIEKISSVYRTVPVDCPPGMPDFCNSALTGYWQGTPEELLDLAQSIEVRLGRPADHGYHLSRTMDIDIVFMEGVVLKSPRLTLPHPEAHRRAFVMEPLREIAPQMLREVKG